jgi:phosphohistidine phosphatase SixA
MKELAAALMRLSPLTSISTDESFPTYRSQIQRRTTELLMTDRPLPSARLWRPLLWMIPAMSVLTTGFSQTLPTDSVATALRTGGYVIVMRHASSPRTLPSAAQANADNTQLERQLDEAGRASARDMGEALRRLKIPIGEVLSSPTYRALETVRLARLGEAKTHSELGDSGASMQAQSDGKRGAWLQGRSAQLPPTGVNTVIVTHSPNMSEAFPTAAGMADGEAIVFRPDGKGSASVSARVKIEDWRNMTVAP